MSGGWQDVAMTIGAIVFIIALLPTVFGPSKPPVSTSLITGLTLAVFAVSFGSLHLWFSAITESIVALMWLVIAVQVMRRDGVSVKHRWQLRLGLKPRTIERVVIDPSKFAPAIKPLDTERDLTEAEVSRLRITRREAKA